MAAVQPSGAGTSGDPYLIASLDNLQWMSETSSSWDSYFRQTADINASATAGWNGGAGWSPVGTLSPFDAFTGEYDGNEKTISFLFMNRTTSGKGMFGNTDSANIIDLGLVNCNIQGISSGSSVGALVGYAYNSTISRCYSTGTVTGNDDVGGLVGQLLDSTMTNCYSSCSISAAKDVGGLVALVMGTSTVLYSYSTSIVPSTGFVVGGLIAYRQNSNTITDSYWDTEVSGQASSDGGTGKTTAQMQDPTTYTTWDTSTVWYIHTSGHYAYLRWSTPLISTVSPTSLSGDAPQTQTFTCSAAGGTWGPYTYQWEKDEVDIGGETASTYTLTNGTYSDSGNYRCTVDDGSTSQNSDNVAVTINNVATVTLTPSSQSVDLADTITINSSVDYFDPPGTAPYCEIGKNYSTTASGELFPGDFPGDGLFGNTIPLANGERVDFDISFNKQGTVFYVSGSGTVFSLFDTDSVNSHALILGRGNGNPGDGTKPQEIYLNGSSTQGYIDWEAAGEFAITYQGYFERNGDGTIDIVATLKYLGRTYTQNITTTSAYPGKSNFSLHGNGVKGRSIAYLNSMYYWGGSGLDTACEGFYRYQYRQETVDIVGATSATYTDSDAQSEDAGNYDLVVTTELGDFTSGTVTVDIKDTPAIRITSDEQYGNRLLKTTFGGEIYYI